MAAGVDIERLPTKPPPHWRKHRRELIVIGSMSVVLILLGGLLLHRAEGRVNRVPLSGTPRPVSVVDATLASYSDSRNYVGGIDSWIEASVGPQYTSAYVTTVLVRPGDSVTRGQILATLDCAHPNAVSRAVQMQAQAIDQQQRATANQAAREATMLKGGFISPNEVEQTSAQSSSERARVLETEAKGLAASSEVHDCALKAPFDGEVAVRSIDPGAFVHPGATIVSVVDRRTVRIVVDAPEKDFNLAALGTPVRVDVLSTGVAFDAAVSRRAPKADPATRTIHFEIDVADPHRQIPTGTTAMGFIRVALVEPEQRQHSQRQIANQMRNLLEQHYPGVEFLQWPGGLVASVFSNGYVAPIAIELQNDDLTTLEDQAHAIATVARSIGGVRHISTTNATCPTPARSASSQCGSRPTPNRLP